MLRKRSRGIGGIICENGDGGALLSPNNHKYQIPTSPFFSSLRLFVGFNSKGFHENESIMSPTSILDSLPFSGIGTHFLFPDKNPTKPLESSADHHHHRVGLADALDENPAPEKPVLFGPQLRIQIPGRVPPPKPTFPEPSPGVFTGCLSVKEMELSEDYTCVIRHGPNPETKHIYGDCIVECCPGIGAGAPPCWNRPPAAAARGLGSDLPPPGTGFQCSEFLNFCFSCKKKLGETDDIFMYRGEKAFCSSECRYQEILFDEGLEKLKSNSCRHHRSHCREIFETELLQ